MNTLFALTSSVLISLILSFILNKGKFSIQQILFCTISGGVMIANCADMFSFPYPSLLVGACAA